MLRLRHEVGQAGRLGRDASKKKEKAIVMACRQAEQQQQQQLWTWVKRCNQEAARRGREVAHREWIADL